MLCNKCKKREATVYYKQNINGKVSEYSLCQECANEAKGLFADDFSPINLFGSFLGTKNTMSPKKRCTLCNCTFDDIRRSGKVGCSECYNVFENELSSTIHNIHGSAKYVGKVPGNVEKTKTKENKLEQLRKEQKEAIEQENYEKAAELRDQIKRMEAEQ